MITLQMSHISIVQRLVVLFICLWGNVFVYKKMGTIWNGEKALIWQFYSLTQKTEVMTDESSDCKHQCIKHQWRYQSFILIPIFCFALPFVQDGCTARSKITVESTMRRNFCIIGFYQCHNMPYTYAIYIWSPFKSTIALVTIVAIFNEIVALAFCFGFSFHWSRRVSLRFPRQSSLNGLKEMKDPKDPKY